MHSASEKLLPYSTMDIETISDAGKQINANVSLYCNDTEEPSDMGYQQTLMYGRYSKEELTLIMV